MKETAKKLITVIILIFGLTGLQAQETVSASGGEASGSGGTASYTVGQIVYTTHTGTTGSVAQGVQQAFEIFDVTGIEQFKSIKLECTAFPNPTNDFLTLKIENSDNVNLSYQIFDTKGNLLEYHELIGNSKTISMSKLVPAIYFLKVNKKQKNIKTFKIIKN